MKNETIEEVSLDSDLLFCQEVISQVVQVVLKIFNCPH